MMNKVIAILILLVASLGANAEEHIAIREFKKNKTAIKLLAQIKEDNREAHFSTFDLSGGCGVAGCSWSTLVILESKDPPTSSHSYFGTVMAIVGGFAPDNSDVSVTFVKFQRIDESEVSKI